MGLHNAANDRQAQAESPLRSRTTRPESDERIENTAPVLRRDPRTVITHLHDDALAVPLRLDDDPTLCVAQGVAQQILDRTLKLALVSVDREVGSGPEIDPRSWNWRWSWDAIRLMLSASSLNSPSLGSRRIERFPLSLEIRGEYTTGPDEGFLDNFELQRPEWPNSARHRGLTNNVIIAARTPPLPLVLLAPRAGLEPATLR